MNKVWKFHNDVDTDQIIASQYLLLPDIEAMKQLLKLIEVKLNGENQWDKIQLMQINWLKSNLNQFIGQME